MFEFKVRLGGPAVPDRVVDIAIVGGGPAGYAAGIYAARAGRDVLLIEKGVPGGQMATTELVENCPGCVEGSGAEIGTVMRRQALKFGLRELTAEVTGMDLGAAPKRIETPAGDVLARVVIVATGAEPRRLGVPGESRLWGRGVSVCATCDAPFFQDRDIVVVGSGSTALQESLYLTRFVRHLTIAHRRDQFRGEAILRKRAEADPKIHFLLDTTVEEILGEGHVEGVRVRGHIDGREQVLPADGVFVFVGLEPNVDLVRDQLVLDANGQIAVDAQMRTSLSGVYAIGDVRGGAARQIVTAMSDGVVAALDAEHVLSLDGLVELHV